MWCCTHASSNATHVHTACPIIHNAVSYKYIRTWDLVLVPDGEGDEEVAGDEQRAVDPVAVVMGYWVGSR